MKITFGICTYNRKDIIEKTAKSLYEIIGIENINIRIYDDCSKEYDLGYLKKLFPSAKTIVSSKKNLGADANTRNMYLDFLSTEDDFLFNADSDLIYNPNILKELEKLITQTDGFLTSFNTFAHPIIRELNENFVEKEHVGAAGTFMTKRVARLIVNSINEYNQKFDWSFCKLLRDNNIRIFCTRNSLVQHIGFIGQNSNITSVDFGSNFEMTSLTNAKILETYIEKFFVAYYEEKKRKVSLDVKIKRKIKHFLQRINILK